MMTVYVFALFFAVLVSPSWGLIEELTATNDDRTSFHIESFGFESGGVFQLDVTDFLLFVPKLTYVHPADEKYEVAFVLERSESQSGLRLDNHFGNDVCFHKSDQLVDGTIVIPLPQRMEDLHYMQTIEIPDFYHLYFSNCEYGTHVSFNLKLSEYNLDNKGNKIYLSVGEANLPTTYGFILVLFVAELITWIIVLKKNSDGHTVKSIHHLMTAVVVLKILTLLLEIFKLQDLRTYGVPDAWDTLYVIVNFVRGMLMFSVIVLIGTGWSLMKAFLTEKDKSIMLVVLVVQFMVNIAMVVLDEETPGEYDWLSWRDFLYFVDIICCCAVLVPIVNSIKHLKEGAEGSGKHQTNLIRLQNFRTFYLLVVAYIYFSRLLVYLLSSTLSFEHVWFADAFTELANLVFYGWTGYLFKPQARILYLPVEEDTVPLSALDEHDLMLEDDQLEDL